MEGIQIFWSVSFLANPQVSIYTNIGRLYSYALLKTQILLSLYHLFTFTSHTPPNMEKIELSLSTARSSSSKLFLCDYLANIGRLYSYTLLKTQILLSLYDQLLFKSHTPPNVEKIELSSEHLSSVVQLFSVQLFGHQRCISI